jgi:serine/threonine protein kinase/flagellar biosynthesis regulator FlbT
MEPERWQKIERLCYSALNEEKSARAAFLQQACGGDEALRRAVELLLAQHEKDDDFLEVPAMEVAAKGLARDQQDGTSRSVSPSAPTETAADVASVEKISFGPYQLLQRLGEGGMGEVWLAEQSKPVRRRVALKVIKAGMDTRDVVARFESERQALALMDHPAIAKVFDAGSTPEGRPYFAMEYVAGLPITAYCDKHRMTTRQRMELFIQVCEGVQHAHQKAIIHRDLKPSNILVSELDGKPMPRIIDFGLAKATSQRLTDGTMYTRVGAILGTLEYMSPEQADSAGEDIDTRTDVYSLGVVLYQLLVGALPLDLKKLAYDEMLRLLRDKDVPKPSSRILTQGGDSAITAKNRGTDAPSLTRQLRGDPDAVVLKALEKDRKRRYGSPSELAADLGRYLRNEPVSAHTPSAAYRTRKYIRRHRLGVAVATGLLAILPAFAVVQRVQLQRTRLERDRANRERDRATRITDFMTGMFQVSDPNEQRGNSVTAREILDKASKDIKTGMTKDPDAQAGMMQVMGEVYLNLGLFSRAMDLEQQSLDIRRRVLGPENPDTLASMDDLAGALKESGHYFEAAKMFREEIDIERRVLGLENLQTLNAMNNLADDLREDGRDEEGEKLNRETLDVSRRVLGPEHPVTLNSMNSLALCLESEGHFPESETLFREVLDTRRRVLGPEHPETLESMNALSFALFAEHRYVEAEKVHREALEINRRVLGPEHPRTLVSMENLGFALLCEGRYAEAEKLERESLDGHRRVFGPEHPQTLNTMAALALVLSREDRYAEAEKLARDSIDISRRVLGPENSSTAVHVYYLACIEARKGNRSEALSLLRQALDHGLAISWGLGMDTFPDLTSLHSDPRFIAMVSEVKKRAAATPR